MQTQAFPEARGWVGREQNGQGETGVGGASGGNDACALPLGVLPAKELLGSIFQLSLFKNNLLYSFLIHMVLFRSPHLEWGGSAGGLLAHLLPRLSTLAMPPPLAMPPG